MLTRHAITRKADAENVDALVVERDYVLAHIVAQLHRAITNEGGRLAFKGGTALRLVHVGDEYRYSADLDFTIVGGRKEAAIAAIAEVLHSAKEHVGLPHLQLTEGNATAVAYIGPLGSARPRSIKLDLATDEYVETIAKGSVLDVWPDLPEAAPFDVYPLTEIGAGKLRCLIQRVQCRDLYDLYRLTDDMGVSVADIRGLFERKAEAKNIDPSQLRSRFEDRVGRYRQQWATEMPEHVPDPPRFDDVIRVVRRHLRRAGLLDT